MMNRIGAANDDKDPFWRDEERASRVVKTVGIVRCALGPLVLFGLLFGTASWDPASATTHVANYFPAGYVNAAGALEDHVQAF
jgi:hypothetical protein